MADNASFASQHVSPADVQISKLSVTFQPPPSAWGRLTKSIGSISKTCPPNKETTSKTIVDGVTAIMPSGSLTAIIGASGSGKTSLLNTIAHRITSRKLKVSGTVTFNGNDNIHAIRNAYIMQQDILLPTLTVRETLQYAADLRLPATTKIERSAAVDRVILELGLKECANTKIGNSAHRGCSGGEKRRVSIGVQLLANPSVLFCDEPTTGQSTFQNFPKFES